MKKLLSIVIAAAFAATSFGALAQDKKDVKSAGGTAKAGDNKTNITTHTAKPKKDHSGTAAMPKHEGKRKTEKERMDKK